MLSSNDACINKRQNAISTAKPRTNLNGNSVYSESDFYGLTLARDPSSIFQNMMQYIEATQYFLPTEMNLKTSKLKLL
jgi:hypothetical protein